VGKAAADQGCEGAQFSRAQALEFLLRRRKNSRKSAVVAADAMLNETAPLQLKRGGGMLTRRGSSLIQSERLRQQFRRMDDDGATTGIEEDACAGGLGVQSLAQSLPQTQRSHQRSSRLLRLSRTLGRRSGMSLRQSALDALDSSHHSDIERSFAYQLHKDSITRPTQQVEHPTSGSPLHRRLEGLQKAMDKRLPGPTPEVVIRGGFVRRYRLKVGTASQQCHKLPPMPATSARSQDARFV
jgi:hypothetical protein